MEKTKVIVKRNLLKTIAWRVVGIIDTIIIGWIVSGNPLVGLTIGSFEIFTKMTLHYLYERVWSKFNFRTKRNRE